jgi:hypothetical protein
MMSFLNDYYLLKSGAKVLIAKSIGFIPVSSGHLPG